MKKYFGTDGIRGLVGKPPISADWMVKLGLAVGQVLLGQLNSNQFDLISLQKPRVLIGKDTRISGDLLGSALEVGLMSAGVDVVRTEDALPTPAVAYLTCQLGADLGIVISASHNPYYDNGIKFFSSTGVKLSDEQERAIESALESPMMTVNAKALGKRVHISDLLDRYSFFCKTTLSEYVELLMGRAIKLVVDCGHGAAYKIAPAVFRDLNIHVIEMGTNPDGFNINQGCGSTNPVALASKVVAEKADLGIALDGDGDRVIMVDHTGSIVDGDALLFILAKWYAATQRLAGGVVGTVMSNYGLEKALESMDIPFVRTAVGDRYVLEGLQQKGWNLGGESSGHILCLDANTTGDAIISALKVLVAMVFFGQSLQELTRGMTRYPQKLINVPISADWQMDVASDPAIQSAIRVAEESLNGQGRVLLRSSGTEPLVRVMVEGQDQCAVEAIALELADVVKCTMA